ncbi:glycosyltransferase [Candidatus Kaiserbacteria bacterium]|nr:glycosyltransferase [Candidatus Kaiserbacteria bacterium]
MKIAIFTDTFPPEVNGVANTVERQARTLCEQGHEVRVFTVSHFRAGELRRRLDAPYAIEIIPSIRVPIYMGIYVTVPIGWTLRAMRRFHPDVIHTHTPFSVGWEAVIASRMLRIPLVGTHHTFFNHYLDHIHLGYAWAQALSWRVTVGYYNCCTIVTSPTRALADEMRRHALKKMIITLPNPIDTTRYSPAKDAAQRREAKAAFGTSGPVLAYTGRVSYEKSIDQAIEAFARVLKVFPGAGFLVVGDGPERPALERFATELHLDSHVRFTGFLYGDEFVRALHAADAFITASKSENMPLAVLEAMASGLPVVAVRSLGLSEIVEDGSNGYLLAPDAPDAMATAVERIFNDADLRARLSARSLELGRSYSSDVIAKRLEEVYADARRLVRRPATLRRFLRHDRAV